VDEGPSLRLNNWLRQVGFARGNPFATSEADRESQFLPEFFVDTGHYDLIWGDPAQPQSTLVFAPRGGGKSAHRLMVQSQCRPADNRSMVLAVPYLSCEMHLSQLRNNHEMRAQDHLAAILSNGLDALVESACRSVDLALQFTPPLCSRLAWFCRQYAPATVSPTAILRRLRLSRDDASPPWREFQQPRASPAGDSWMDRSPRSLPSWLMLFPSHLELQISLHWYSASLWAWSERWA